MKTLAIHAMYRLRVAMQLGAISRRDLSHRLAAPRSANQCPIWRADLANRARA